MDVFEAMATRRSVKKFTSQPVETDKILQVIQAGTLAPSSGNIQNWSFLVVNDIAKIRELYDHTLQQEPFLSATAAVIVCGDVDQAHRMYGMRGKRLYTIQNCAAAIENMLLAAHALGLGAIWIGAFDEDKVSFMFEIPNTQHRPQAIVLLGYPDVEVYDKERKLLEDVVFFNAYGNRVARPHLIFYDWATEWRNQAAKAKQHATFVKEKVVTETVEEKPEESALFRTKQHIRNAIDKLKRER